MICDEYSKEKEGTMTVISNGSIDENYKFSRKKKYLCYL